MVGAIIGPHIIGSIGPWVGALRRWQPRLITVLDPSPGEMRALRAVCPKATIVGRVYADDGEVQRRIVGDPERAALWAHSLTMGRMTKEVDYWQVANEVLQDWGGLPFLNRFEVERMRLAEQNGYRCGILGFSVGNPDLPAHDRLALWRQVEAACVVAQNRGHVVILHQYGKPTLWGPDPDWYIHRLEHQVLPILPLSQLRFAVTEYGIDGLIHSTDGKPRGWAEYTSAADYVEQLTKIGQYVEKFSDRVIGYTVFQLGDQDRWRSYDIQGAVVEGLVRFYEGRAIDKVDGLDGAKKKEKTDGGGVMGEVNQARNYDVNVLPATGVAEGARYWKVVEVRHLSPLENRSKHNVYVDVVDEAGQRIRDNNLRIGWDWVGRRADERADPMPLDKPDSEPAGNVPLGHPGQVTRVWVIGHGLASEAVENLHSNHPDEPTPGTNDLFNTRGHHSFYVRFQRTVAGAVIDKPTEPLPVDPDLAAEVARLRAEVAGLVAWKAKVVAFMNEMIGE